MERGQQESGQRQGNLLDEGKPGEQGLPSSGRRRRRLGETPGQPSRAATSQALGHVCALGHLFLPDSLPSTQLSFIQVLEKQRLRQSLGPRCERARDTRRDCVEQPQTGSGGDTVQGKDGTFHPCCPLAVLVTGIFTPGKPQHRGRVQELRPSPSQEPPCPAAGTKNQL